MHVSSLRHVGNPSDPTCFQCTIIWLLQFKQDSQNTHSYVRVESTKTVFLLEQLTGWSAFLCRFKCRCHAVVWQHQIWKLSWKKNKTENVKTWQGFLLVVSRWNDKTIFPSPSSFPVRKTKSIFSFNQYRSEADTKTMKIKSSSSVLVMIHSPRNPRVIMGFPQQNLIWHLVSFRATLEPTGEIKDS